jgi:hypothetical protein
MQSRRRPLSVYNANVDSKTQSVSDHSSYKRQRNISHQTPFEKNENNNGMLRKGENLINNIYLQSKGHEITDSDEEPLLKPNTTVIITRDEQMKTKTNVEDTLRLE